MQLRRDEPHGRERARGQQKASASFLSATEPNVSCKTRETGCAVHGINFNIHGRNHIVRAAQEGIVFSFRYGIDVMKGMGMDVNKIHAGQANMFLSPSSATHWQE